MYTCSFAEPANMTFYYVNSVNILLMLVFLAGAQYALLLYA